MQVKPYLNQATILVSKLLTGMTVVSFIGTLLASFVLVSSFIGTSAVAAPIDLAPATPVAILSNEPAMTDREEVAPTPAFDPDQLAFPTLPPVPTSAATAITSPTSQLATTPSLTQVVAALTVPVSQPLTSSRLMQPAPAAGTQLVSLDISAIGLHTAAVPVGHTPTLDEQGQPLYAADGRAIYQWGVDSRRAGLQTPELACGSAGNLVLNGHHWQDGSGVFAHLDQLQVDSAIICQNSDGSRYTYRIFAGYLYAPTDDSFVALPAGETHTLTLYTCTTDGSHRLVYHARLEEQSVQ